MGIGVGVGCGVQNQTLLYEEFRYYFFPVPRSFRKKYLKFILFGVKPHETPNSWKILSSLTLSL